jgi:hypothetical protein
VESQYDGAIARESRVLVHRDGDTRRLGQRFEREREQRDQRCSGNDRPGGE